MNLDNLKIGTRLTLGFFIVLALMVGLATIGIVNMTHIEDSLDHVVDDNVRKMGLLDRMAKSVHIVSRVTRSLIILTDEQQMAVEAKKIQAARQNYDQARAELEKMPASEKGQLLRSQIAAIQDRARPLNNKVIQLALANQNAEATELLIKQAAPATQAWQELLDENMSLQEESNALETQAARATYARAKFLMLALTGLAVLVGGLLSWLVTRSITRPIDQALGLAKTVAEGDLTVHVPALTSDEMGHLLLALNDMNDALHNIVGKVRSGAESISSAAGQIASGNLDLSARTEQQASSLEETASAIEEMTSIVKQNSASAHEADELARCASTVALKGGTIVTRVVDTMGAIDASSRKIVDIIAVIEGIAFQTNILALNAAVEAARAGEQGRGFAVVATEVRNLAQRSAAAAKEIKVLIDDSVGQVRIGSQLVNEAGSTMGEIVSSVARVTAIMAEIATASREQETGIDQIHQSITEMDTVTQQNAAMVEEAAAAAAALHAKADELMQIVSVFKLNGTHHTAAHPATRQPAGVPRQTRRLALGT